MSLPSSGSNSKPSKKLAETGGKLSLPCALLFYPEDESDMFLQNIGHSLSFMALGSGG
jgi:hypothetical protein